jgi:ligand-binding sensor domain-containing protein
LSIYTFLILNCIVFAGFSQQKLSFRQLSVNDGLSQNSAVSVTQDHEGFLWIATQEGLNRYDGKEFRIYSKKFIDITQETHLQLGKVFADSKNRIWIIPDYIQYPNSWIERNQIHFIRLLELKQQVASMKMQMEISGQEVS